MSRNFALLGRRETPRCGSECDCPSPLAHAVSGLISRIEAPIPYPSRAEILGTLRDALDEALADDGAIGERSPLLTPETCPQLVAIAPTGFRGWLTAPWWADLNQIAEDLISESSDPRSPLTRKAVVEDLVEHLFLDNEPLATAYVRFSNSAYARAVRHVQDEYDERED